MYSAKFVKDDESTFYFDYDHHVIVDIDPLTELDVDIATSQGFQQVGTTVENRSVGGVSRRLNGTIIGSANELKQDMLDIFTPFSSGKLYFNNKYFCECVVEKAPAIGVGLKDVNFQIVLYCEYPYWLGASQNESGINMFTAAFRFPVCYDEHIFGIINTSAFTTIINEGNIDAGIDITFGAVAQASNFGIINIDTLEMLKINDTITVGETVRVYRVGTSFYVTKTVDGVTTDIFSCLDEDSNLFYMHPGENVIRCFADDDAQITASIKFYTVYSGVYDGM